MLAYLRLELARMLRSPRLYVFTVAVPVGLYLIFTSVGDAREASATLAPYAMVAMVCYGALFASLSSAPGTVEDRTIGWLRQLRATPLRPSRVVAVKLLTSMAVVVPAIAAVCAAAILVGGVHLALGRWVLLVALLWAGAIPLALLGVAVGYLSTPRTSQAIGISASLGLSLLGGLLIPIAEFPPALRHVAQALPTYRYAELGWRVGGGSMPTTMDVAILLVWCAAFAALAVFGYRRTGRAA
jgi:ABC-2 type transport system permease protein